MLTIEQKTEDDRKLFKDLAGFIKKEFETKYGGAWHVIVGTNFGCYVSYEKDSMIYFWLDWLGFLIYKYG